MNKEVSRLSKSVFLTVVASLLGCRLVAEDKASEIPQTPDAHTAVMELLNTPAYVRDEIVGTKYVALYGELVYFSKNTGVPLSATASLDGSSMTSRITSQLPCHSGRGTIGRPAPDDPAGDATYFVIDADGCEIDGKYLAKSFGETAIFAVSVTDENGQIDPGDTITIKGQDFADDVQALEVTLWKMADVNGDRYATPQLYFFSYGENAMIVDINSTTVQFVLPTTADEGLYAVTVERWHSNNFGPAVTHFWLGPPGELPSDMESLADDGLDEFSVNVFMDGHLAVQVGDYPDLFGFEVQADFELRFEGQMIPSAGSADDTTSTMRFSDFSVQSSGRANSYVSIWSGGFERHGREQRVSVRADDLRFSVDGDHWGPESASIAGSLAVATTKPGLELPAPHVITVTTIEPFDYVGYFFPGWAGCLSEGQLLVNGDRLTYTGDGHYVINDGDETVFCRPEFDGYLWAVEK